MAHIIDNQMVMKCVAYQNGVSIGDVTIEDISDVLKLDDTFVWLGLLEAVMLQMNLDFDPSRTMELRGTNQRLENRQFHLI